jgi:uncharacterized protein with PIN domain
VIVTRDRKLVKRLGRDGCCLVCNDSTEGQFNELVSQCDLKFQKSAFLSRCAVCNGNAFDLLGKDEVATREEVKQKVVDAVDEFWECRKCHKLYWEGPKFDTACKKFLGLVDDSEGESDPGDGSGDMP